MASVQAARMKRLPSIAFLVAACGGTVVPATPTATTTPSAAAVGLPAG